ncbi:MAG TPA: flagellar motor switch protein FliM [Bryobacteraceae bacterium]|nr:flagellar motor switch protein FliM [Bryobacteraceae bacterium]
MDRVLTQQEIDNAFKAGREAAPDQSMKAEVYDFRRTDRIAKDQLRTIHLLHENFARSLSSSLSAYLRSYAVVNLISVEQLSFREFTQSLPSPTSLVVLGMKPYDGSGVLEINPSLVFPVLEMILGGSGKSSTGISRETTDIEQNILDGFLRVILNDLRAAWISVASIEFSIDSHEAEPQLLQFLAHNEAVVAISIEVKIGETSGLMNLGIPSITVKMLRQKLDQHRTIRRTQPTEEEHIRLLRLIRPAELHLDARLEGPMLGVPELLDLAEGDVLCFDFPETRPIDLAVNGSVKYEGSVVAAGGKRGLQIRRAVAE